MKILVIGDVVGRPGRETVTKFLPQLREEHSPDAVIINIENIAHGAGISPKTWEEVKTWQADVYTTGDHAWDNDKGLDILNNKKNSIIRPANYPDGVAGRGYHMFTNGAYQVVVINLQGQVFFRSDPRSPFEVIDEILEIPEVKNSHIKLVDFHAEATSEKRAFSWYVDGRVSAVWGTHTHVPTADAHVMPGGTGYISDVGMAGSHHSVIGVDKTPVLKSFLTQIKQRKEFTSDGPLELGGLLLDINPKTGHANSLEHIRRVV